MKPTKGNLSKLEDVFSELKYNVRYEKGSFKPNYCIVEEKKLILINAFYDIESRFSTLKEILINLPHIQQHLPLLSDVSKKVCAQLHPEWIPNLHASEDIFHQEAHDSLPIEATETPDQP